MSKTLFVGNLDWGVTQEDLQQEFSKFGDIEEAVVITDKFSGKSKGFGFVTYKNDEDSEKAKKEMNEQEIKGRKIVVDDKKEKENR